MNAQNVMKSFSDALTNHAYPPIYAAPRVLTHQGRTCVAVIIPGSENRRHFAGKAYIREGTQTKESSDEQFARLIAERQSDAEIRGLQWGRVDLIDAMVTVGDSKTEAGQGRTIPLNSDAQEALVAHAKSYLKKFGETRPEWYLFPFGKPQPTDPKRPMTSLKTVWARVKKDAKVTGQWHDSRHTFITDLAESGEAGDETIRDLAGHVSKNMLKHYSHIRTEAKRRAVDWLVKKPAVTQEQAQNSIEPAKDSAKVAKAN